MTLGTVLVVCHDAGAALAERLPDEPRLSWQRVDPEQADGELVALLGEPRSTDQRPVAVLGIGGVASEAVETAAEHGRVRAMALIGPRLGPDAIGLLSEWPELPVLAVADPNHRPGLRGAVDAFLASGHHRSRLRVGPIDEEALRHAADWLADRLARSDRVEEVSLRSSDGWDLYATCRLPERDSVVPGVVLLHTGRSDRSAFARLERLLSDAGLAALSLDWRGRGQSTNLGSYFELSDEVKAAAWRDAMAALEHLAGRPEVDSDRLATVGVVHGAEYAARAAHRDPRVKAVALLTGYRPTEPAEAPHLTSGSVDVLYVTSTDHTVTTDAMRALYDASSGSRTRYIEYPGAALGYQLFELDPSLEPTIVAWLAEVLGA